MNTDNTLVKITLNLDTKMMEEKFKRGKELFSLINLVRVLLDEGIEIYSA